MTRSLPPSIVRALRASLCATALGAFAAGAANAAAPALHYETVVMQGSTALTAALFRINIATGQATMVWGANTQFVPVIDNTPIPPGEYHLQASSWVIDGKAVWDVYRVDVISGRTWNGLGGGTAPLIWTEVVAAK